MSELTRARFAHVILVCLLACGGPSAESSHVTGANSRSTGAVRVLPPEQARATQLAAEEVLRRRCVVCHGCYDSPCQLQLGSVEGIQRGASEAVVYDGARLWAAPPTRLTIDAHGERAWRSKGFFTVLGPSSAPERGVLARMLELKRQHPLPTDVMLSDHFDLGINRKQICPDADHFPRYAADHPLWGMPYALPGLSEPEQRAIADWLAADLVAQPMQVFATPLAQAIERWEDFLNGRDAKSRLSARYIYEHLFLGSLYFAEVDTGTFFRIVRSRTPTGQEVDEIPARRPFDDPGTALYYYRFVKREGPVLDKTHMPYALSDARLARFRELFIDPYYEVPELPGYEPEIASNPLRAFGAIPMKSRYRFMLEEAEFTMGGFIKGPVCRGQVALNVIEDRFWVVFVDPEVPWLAEEAAMLARTSELLALPAEEGSNASLFAWRSFTAKHAAFVKQKSDFLERQVREGVKVNLDVLWKGDGHNQNAALTVFRHFDNATVVKGLVGDAPKTTWVVGYSLLERIHALLVAGFDVFGNVGHQIDTRMYMDFLRMEGEYNYLLLLPPKRRKELVEYWYRDADADVKARVYGSIARFAPPSNIPYRHGAPELELAEMLQAQLASVSSQQYSLPENASPLDLRALRELGATRGRPASLMPETSFLAVRGLDGRLRNYTLLRESAHTNVAELFGERDRREPTADRLLVVPGFLGAYPNALFRTEEDELTAFVTAVRSLDTRKDYGALRARFGVLRSSRDFWSHSDALHEGRTDFTDPSAGLLDYNRLDPY
jgi:hypothetical protein